MPTPDVESVTQSPADGSVTLDKKMERVSFVHSWAIIKVSVIQYQGSKLALSNRPRRRTIWKGRVQFQIQ